MTNKYSIKKRIFNKLYLLSQKYKWRARNIYGRSRYKRDKYYFGITSFLMGFFASLEKGNSFKAAFKYGKFKWITIFGHKDIMSYLRKY